MGFLHRDRPGRTSLALDLMEELRPCLADRFVLTLINNRVVGRADFDFRGSGAVLLGDAGRRAFLKRWQERKQETITHPYLKEKIPWGTGALRAGAAAGANAARRPGRLSALFVEVRRLCWF